MNLRSWMRRSPPATHLRFDQKKVFELGTGKNKWADAQRAVENYQPKMVECLNAEGHVLRVTRVEVPDEEPAPEESIKGVNERMSEFAQIAEIITRSNAKAVEMHEKFVGKAFDKNYELVQILSDRMSGLETAWQQSIAIREQQVDDALANAPEAEEDPVGGVIGNLIELASASRNVGVPKNAASIASKKAGKK